MVLQLNRFYAGNLFLAFSVFLFRLIVVRANAIRPYALSNRKTMIQSLNIQTQVLPEHKIEISTPTLSVGENIDQFVSLPPSIGMGNSGMGNLSEQCEELLWQSPL
jgi:hypothetical protein